MSSIGVVRDLAEFFMPIGIVGAVIAVLCALVAAVALASGSGAVCGGAVAVWIGGAMLSLASGFSGEWIPAIVACGALLAMLVIGALVRVPISRLSARPKPERVATDHVSTDHVSAERIAPGESVSAAARPRLADGLGGTVLADSGRL